MQNLIYNSSLTCLFKEIFKLIQRAIWTMCKLISYKYVYIFITEKSVYLK